MKLTSVHAGTRVSLSRLDEPHTADAADAAAAAVAADTADTSGGAGAGISRAGATTAAADVTSATSVAALEGGERGLGARGEMWCHIIEWLATTAAANVQPQVHLPLYS